MLAGRTTVVINSDAAAEVERLRRNGLGVSEALNLLARRGMAAQTSAPWHGTCIAQRGSA